jgi:hypothetical protein
MRWRGQRLWRRCVPLRQTSSRARPHGALSVRWRLWNRSGGPPAGVPPVFGDPDRFEPQRSNASDHLAFGKGLHYCLGASLGGLEARLPSTIWPGASRGCG